MSDAGNPGGAGGAGGAGGTGGAGGATDPAAFLAQIPEDIRGEAAFRDIKDVGALARSYVNGQKLLGVPQDQLLRLPGDDKPESMAPIWSRLGRPESADKYQLADPAADQVPPGLVLDPAAKTAFAAKAHELGLGQKQADALYQFLNAGRIEAYQGYSKAESDALAAAETQLKSEFGQAYDQAVELSNSAIDHLDATLKLGGGLEKAIAAMPPDARGPLFKAFAEIGKLYQEHKIIGQGAGGGHGNAVTPAEAQQQINAKRGDPNFSRVYLDKTQPGHADAVAEMARLYDMAYPPQNAA